MGGSRHNERITLIPTTSTTRRAFNARATRLVYVSALIVTAALLAACAGGPELEPDVPAGVDLSGPWRLNRQASQDPQVLIAQLQAKVSKRARYTMDDMLEDEIRGPVSRGGQGGGERRDGGATDTRPSGGGATSGSSAAGSVHRRGGPGGFLKSRYGQALGDRISGDGISIEQSRNGFVIVRGESRRSYTPGGRSVVSVTDGVADQSSGWKGREFMIDVRPQVGPHLTERYGLTADGQLIEKVLLREDGLPTLEFTRVYDRGVAPDRVLPTSN